MSFPHLFHSQRADEDRTVSLGLQPLGSKRKTPTQTRAKATVAALVEATAQILERRGEEAVTTKSVAERAGVSIGTLYQYFDDRDGLLLAVADAERQRLAERLRTFLDAGLKERPDDALPKFVSCLVRSFARRRGARRQFALLTAMADKGSSSTFADLVAANLRRIHPDAASSTIQADAFVLNYALQGVLRAAAVRNSPLLEEPAFEAALCRLVRGLVSRRHDRDGINAQL